MVCNKLRRLSRHQRVEIISKNRTSSPIGATQRSRTTSAGRTLSKIDNTNPGRHGFKGSLIIADFNSLREAETWASEDPYFKIGVYKKIEVNPFKYVLP